MNALILQGWYQKSDSNWYPWLKDQLLKKDYKVFLPNLPTIHTDLPNMEKQLSFIEKSFDINSESLLFGHSLGCLLALRIAEKFSFKKMFLVAGWDFNDLTAEHKLFWKHPINHKKIKQNVSKIYCISSDNDPYVTTFTAEEMSKRLGAKFILIKGAGHFTDQFNINAIPEILEYV